MEYYDEQVYKDDEPTFNIDPQQNYKRLDTGWIHTGQQIINLLELATPDIQAIILLGIQPTDEAAGKPNDRYGIPD